MTTRSCVAEKVRGKSSTLVGDLKGIYTGGFAQNADYTLNNHVLNKSWVNVSLFSMGRESLIL